jgi:ferredoxin
MRCAARLRLFTCPGKGGGAQPAPGRAYKQTPVDGELCNGCGNCEETCWYDGVNVKAGKAARPRAASAAATASGLPDRRPRREGRRCTFFGF